MKKTKLFTTLALSFLLPAIVLTLIFYLEKYYPWGDKSLLIMDMSGQYVEFFNALKSGDIFFSWSKSLGTNYIGVFAYYVSSPLSALTLLFPNDKMPLAVMLLTVLKIGLCGVSFSFFLLKRFGREDLGNTAFSSAYALMSYNIAYSMCLMWLDAVIWLPIIILGIENIISEKRWTLFCFSLLVCLISNYYISYMIILFCCIFFCVRCMELRLSWRDIWGSFRRFTAAGVLSAGLGAFFLLPTFLSHFDGKLSSSLADYGSYLNFTAPQILRKMLLGGYDSITSSGTPNIYCGILVILFAILFFVSKKAALRNKLCNAALLLILLLSMWVAPLDKVWHVFLYPNWFPFRYSFLFSFVLICAAYQGYTYIEFKAKNLETLAAGLVTVIMLVNLFTNTMVIFRGLDGQFGYESYSEYAQFREKKSALLACTEQDADFFRIGSYLDRSKNDALGFGYNGITHYSSSYLESLNSCLSDFGMAQTYIWSGYYGSTAVTDCFFGVKYVISDAEPNPDYELMAEQGGSGIYRNPYYSSTAFFSPAQAGEFYLIDNPFENQNRLFECLTEADVPFYSMDFTKMTEDDNTIITLTSNGNPMYCYVPNAYSALPLYVNGEFLARLYVDGTSRIQYLGSFPKGSTVTLKIESSADIPDFLLYYLDENIFRAGVEILNSNALTVTDAAKSGLLTGEINCPTDGTVTVSIPASRGWKIFVDGIKTDYDLIYDTFISIPVSAGEHTLEMRYTAPGLWLGLAVSLASFAILVCWMVISKNRKQGRGRGGALIR